MPGAMRLTFLLSLGAMALLYITLFKYELAAKHASIQLRRLSAGSRATRPVAAPARSAAPQHL